jgi:hypothetical protein
MRPLTRGGLLILVAFSIPLFVELRTVAGFFGIDLPLVGVAVLAVLFYAGLLLAYYLSQPVEGTAA